MFKKENDYNLIKFVDGDFSLDVKVSPSENTIWLSQKEIAILFGKSKSTINEHIKNILNSVLEKEMVCRKFGKTELCASVVAENATAGIDGKVYNTKYYNLDMILAVGYRVKSNRINRFKNWALSTLNMLKANNASSKPLIVFQHGNISIDVSVDPSEETVWLNQNDMALLFETTKQNISLHIKNILLESELDNSVVKDFFTTAQDGKQYQTKMYNLDMIIAVGYRINSKRGTLFRKWATTVLKDYLLKGYAIDEDRLNIYKNMSRIDATNIDIIERLNSLENIVYNDNNKVIYEGEIIEPYTFLRKLFFLAKKEIVITDYYADKFLLSMLADIKVNVTIITSTSSYLNKEIIPHNIKIIYDDYIHDRFIFVDDLAYVIGTSFNDIGKKRFVIMRLNNITKEMVIK